jgi:hypothetical protein
MWPFDPIHKFLEPIVTNFDDALDALSDSDFIQAYSNNELSIPIVESLHILAVAFVVGTILFVDLRLWASSAACRCAAPRRSFPTPGGASFSR